LSGRAALAGAVLALLLVPASAAANVLVNAPKASVACGKSVKLGVWYQSFSGGPRWAKITVKNSKGNVVWHKSVTATTPWQYWYYKGKCASHYVAIYKTARGTSKFAFHVRKHAPPPPSPGFY
jgi:hypothetical protein